jgi:membrane-bound ClpP family serine protease
MTITADQYKREQLDTIIAGKEKEVEELKEEMAKERAMMIERLEDAKTKNQSIADEFIQKKNDYKREIALTTQHIEFQAKKITDLERALEEANKRYNEKLKSLKDETGFEYTDTIEKLSAEKSALEKRLESKR